MKVLIPVGLKSGDAKQARFDSLQVNDRRKYLASRIFPLHFLGSMSRSLVLIRCDSHKMYMNKSINLVIYKQFESHKLH